MTTPPSSNQILRVPGELQIDSSAGYKSSNGLISFIGQFNQKLGQIRAYGFGAFNSLLFDGSDCGAGIQFRSNKNQGDSLIDGKSDQFPLRIETDTTKIRFLRVGEDQTSFYNQHNASTLMEVTRSNTNNTSILTNTLARFNQLSMKIGETFQVELGPSSFGGTSLWSWTQGSTTSSSAADNYSSLSMRRSGTTKENIRLLTNGDINIPNRADIGTVSATTYLNLPGLAPSDVLPITLDKTNNRVGINNTSPSVALSVVGDGYFSNRLTCSGQFFCLNNQKIQGDISISKTSTSENGIIRRDAGNPEGVVNADIGSLFMRKDGSAGTCLYVKESGTGNTGWAAVGQTDLSPITLDKSTNRVGINTTQPPDETLQVGGDCHIDNQLRCADVQATSGTFQNLGASQYINTPKLVVNVASVTSGDGVPTDLTLPRGSLYMRGDGDTNLYTLTENSGWKPVGGFEPSDLLPITLDKTNNRVGINKTTPKEALDITGSINCNSYKINGITAVYTNNDGTQLMLGKVDPLPLTADNAIAIGYLAGAGANSIGLGYCAGRYGQGPYAVSIGYLSATNNQGSSAVAVGSRAGNANQGADAVAIGVRAGETNQHARTICINALETTALNTNRTDALFINPIRNTTTTPTNVLTYNTTTKEVTYGPFSGSSTSVGSSMMVTNQSLTFPVNRSVVLTLPSTGSLVSTFSKGCTETTTAVSCVSMGVTYNKNGIIQFTQTGVYQFNLRTTNGDMTPGQRSIQFIFRLNGVDVNNSDIKHFTVNNDEPELFINFSQYVDATKVNELYYSYYNNHSAVSTVKFSVTITRIA
jgi:hypothetical protein